MKFRKVFIVDDDKIFHFIIRKLLIRQSELLELSFFENGSDAIDELRQLLQNGNCLPDLIFLDINMPVLDGWQFLEEYKMLKGSFQAQPVIYLVSSSDNSCDRDRAREYEDLICRYYLKPMGQREIESIFVN